MRAFFKAVFIIPKTVLKGEHMNEFRDLTDAEYKVLQFIKSYNKGRNDSHTPSAEYIALKLGKGRTTAFRILASLRSKGIHI